MNTSSALVQGAISLIVAGVPAAIIGRFAYKQATKVQEIASQHTDRAAFTDDLQEEVAALRGTQREINKEVSDLRFQMRTLTDYLYLCITIMRRNDIEPPPVPAAVRLPWEEI